MKFSEMTGLESEYFKQKEKECREFTEKDKAETSKTAIIMLLVGGLIVIGMIVVVNFKWH